MEKLGGTCGASLGWGRAEGHKCPRQCLRPSPDFEAFGAPLLTLVLGLFDVTATCTLALLKCTRKVRRFTGVDTGSHRRAAVAKDADRTHRDRSVRTGMSLLRQYYRILLWFSLNAEIDRTRISWGCNKNTSAVLYSVARVCLPVLHCPVVYGCFLVIEARGGTWFRTPCHVVVRSRSKCPPT